MSLSTAELEAARQRMVSGQLAARGVVSPSVLRAMGEVERDRFVPSEDRDYAYEDRPLPIGHRQTISQPYIVAVMTELLRTAPTHRALEIGAGSGYQAAVLSKLVEVLWTIEVVPELAQSAAATLRAVGAENVHVVCGDGHNGLAGRAPFDCIILTAAPRTVPKVLLEQLAPGGRLVAPIGDERQELIVYEKDRRGEIHQTPVCLVSFVPMINGGLH